MPPGEQHETLQLDNLPVFDKDLAVKRANNQPVLANELLTILINNLKNDKILISQSFTPNNWQPLREHLHKLYGATLYCGVPKLEASIKDLQIQIKADQEIEQITNSYNSVLTCIEEVLIQYKE